MSASGYPFLSIVLAPCAICAICSGCATGPSQPVARAELRPASGSQVKGMALFSQNADGVTIVAGVSGLSPGEHGMHVHEVGDCSAPDAGSAKGHFNPTGARHGHLLDEHHAGDLRNLRADAKGNAEYREHVPGLSLDGSENNIAGRALIIHADADDYNSQPAGNSGRRVACGVIEIEHGK